MAIAIITVLIYGFVVIYFYYIVVSDLAFRFSKRRYKWIKIEWRLLGALLADFDEVTRSGNQITQKASTLMDPGPVQAGLTLQLNEKETSWIANARKAVACVSRFQMLKKNRRYPRLFFFVLVDLVPMIKLALDMYWAAGVLGEKKLCADICRSLEQMSSKVRSLQDRSYVDEVEGIPTAQLGLRIDPELIISSVRTSASEEPEVKFLIMHLQLLQAFMKDLRRLKVLESRREESWVMEAKKTLEKAKGTIESINKEGADQQTGWFSVFRDRRRGRKLKRYLMYLIGRILLLLETKERHGFKFIKRDLSSNSSVHHTSQRTSNQYHITDDKDLSALENIRNQLIQLPKTSDKVVSHVFALIKELENIQKLFQDTKATEYASTLRNSFLEQMKKIVCEVERYSNSESKYESEIQQFIDAVIILQQCVKVYSVEVRKESCLVVGFDKDIHKLVQQLTANSEFHIISIGGMNGIGKTALAKKVYHNGTIASHFEVRQWVLVPHIHNENTLLRSVGSQIVKSEDNCDAKDFWIKTVRNFLKEKRYLLVLDNVPSKEILGSLQAAFFPEMTNGSKVVLTSRNKALAVHVDTDENRTHYPLRLRTQKESWEFFTQMVHILPQEEVIAKAVVARTGGLPLVILRLGYRLSMKKVTTEELSRLLDRITHGKNQTPWSNTLALNKKELQEADLELFPGEFEIPARRLVALWVAKGLFETEDLANKHLLELIDRNLLQVVGQKRNGDVRTCCLPPPLRELWMKDKVEKSSSITYSWSQSTSSEQQRVSYHCDRNDATFNRIHGLNMNSSNGKHPRSVVFFDTREGNKPGEEIGEFLQRCIACGFFQKLQVLDLERVFRPQLPASLKELKQLTYLGLRWTCLEEIPSSIGNLVKLQTLDLRHTNLLALPKSIWNLKELKHIYFNKNCRIKARSLPTSIPMTKLQTLSGVFMDKASVLKNRLDKLINLRKLKLTFNLQDQKVLENWILHLNQLESLKMVSTDENFLPGALNLESFSNLRNLSSLYLYGELRIPSILDHLPGSLTHLILSASGISDDPMPKLGRLPNLKSLALNSGSYQGKYMFCSTNGFPQLVVLKLWNLKCLEKMDVEGGAMPNLRELEVRNCTKFKSQVLD